MKLILVLSLLIGGFFTAGPLSSTPQEKHKWDFLEVGEELEYSLKWGIFKVGKGYLRVEPTVEMNGVECYHLVLEVSTNSFADVIYKVRNEFHSYVRKEDPRVVLYRINQHEGNTHRDATVFFDWDEMTATYQRDGEQPKDPVEIGDYTWDPLSVVYHFRDVMEEGFDRVSLPATDGKKYLSIDIENHGLEKIETQLGEFEAFKVEPNTKEMKGVFQKSKDSNILMWYSNDEKHFPLMIKSKVIVGSFYAELKKVRNVSQVSEE